MMTEDFTKLAVGSLVSGSRTIVRCPLCGRFGALDLRDDGRNYTAPLRDFVPSISSALVSLMTAPGQICARMLCIAAAVVAAPSPTNRLTSTMRSEGILSRRCKSWDIGAVCLLSS